MDQLFDQYNFLKGELIRIEREIINRERRMSQLENILDRMDNDEPIREIYLDRDHVLEELNILSDEVFQLEREYDTTARSIEEIERVLEDIL